MTNHRYILIDNASGYIWGDLHAATPVDAAHALNESNGEYGRAFEDGYSLAANEGGYWVYLAAAAIPKVDDGQDAELIERVKRECRLVATLRSRIRND